MGQLYYFKNASLLLFRVNIDDSGNLVIESASKLDQGRYQCSAKNLAITRDSRPVRLRVHGKFKIREKRAAEKIAFFYQELEN